MNTSELIDSFYEGTNGALSRSQLLVKINDVQNRLYDSDVKEMWERDTFSVTEETVNPTFGSIALTASGAIASGTTYEVGDAVSYVPTGAASGETLYFMWTAPFTTTTPSNATVCEWSTDLEYMVPITANQYNQESVSVEQYVADGSSTHSAGDILHYGGVYYLCLSDFTATDFDTLLSSCVVTRPYPYIIGSVSTWSETVPTYVEIDGLHRVEKVGTLDSEGEWTQLYEPRIVQSEAPGEPVLIYTDGLLEDVDLTYEGYRWPDQLTSESDELTIPTTHRMGVLRSAINMEIEEESFGNSNYWYQRYEKDLDDWTNWLNRDKIVPRTERRVAYNPLAG